MLQGIEKLFNQLMETILIEVIEILPRNKKYFSVIW